MPSREITLTLVAPAPGGIINGRRRKRRAIINNDIKIVMIVGSSNDEITTVDTARDRIDKTKR